MPTARAILAVVLACAGCVAGRVQAQAESTVPTTQYTVVAGDSCASIAERFFGNRRRYDIIHAYNPGMGPPPHDLVAGRVLILPTRIPSAAEVPDARVTVIRRDVLSRSAEAPTFRPASRGQALFRGWRVNTLERSSAQLTFADTSIVEIRSNTLIVIYGASATATRAATSSTVLERGTLRARLGSLRGEVDTPAAVAEFDGGSAVVAADGAGSRVSRHEGRRATVRSVGRRGRTVALDPGFGSVVPNGAPPSAPRPLLVAPAVVSDSPRRFAAVGDAGATVEGRFVSVPGAASYRVELLRDADGAPEVITEVEVPAEVTRFSLQGMPPGRYRITFATIDAVGLEGVPSSASVYEVFAMPLDVPGASAPLVPPVGDEPVDSRQAIREVPVGSRLDVPAELRCDGTDPDGHLLLGALGPVTIACTLADGLPVAPIELLVVGEASPSPEPPEATDLPPAPPPAPEPPAETLQAPPTARGDDPRPEPPRPTADVSGNLPEPTAMGALASTERDVELGAAAGLASPPSASLRGSVGIRLHRDVRFDLAIGGRAPSAASTRRYAGEAVVVGLRARVFGHHRADVWLLGDAWVTAHPRRGLAEGPLFRPSIMATLVPSSAIALRLRAGSVLDLRGPGVRAFTLSAMLDHAFADRWWIGVELATLLGRRDLHLEANGTLGAYVAGTFGATTLTAYALTSPWDAFAADVTVGVSTRFRSDVPRTHHRRPE